MQNLMTFMAIITPFVVLYNCIMISSLLKKANRFEQVLAKYEGREQTRLHNDAMEALTLLRSGKTDEARKVAERIVTS